MRKFEAKPRGRPKDAECRRRIVSAARDLFLEHGMQAVSVDAIAEQASVSNRTVYSHFSSKEELLRAVMTHEAESLRPQLPMLDAMTVEAYRVQLVDFGVSLIRLLTTPSIVALGRLMISECVRHPEMAHDFYQWGPNETQRKLAELLSYGRDQNWLTDQCDPNQAACHLLALWQGQWLFQQQLGLAGPKSRRQATEHATECVDVFLLAFGTR